MPAMESIQQKDNGKEIRSVAEREWRNNVPEIQSFSSWIWHIWRHFAGSLTQNICCCQWYKENNHMGMNNRGSKGRRGSVEGRGSFRRFNLLLSLERVSWYFTWQFMAAPGFSCWSVQWTRDYSWPQSNGISCVYTLPKPEINHQLDLSGYCKAKYTICPTHTSPG